MNDLVDQISSLNTTFWRVVVTNVIYALLVPSKCIDPVISSSHVLGRAFPLHEVRHAKLVLEVGHVFSYLLVGVEAAVRLGDVGVTTRAIIIIIGGLAQYGWVNVLTAAALIPAHIHGHAARVLLARRVVTLSKAAIVALYVQVATCPVDLVHGLERVIALINDG